MGQAGAQREPSMEEILASIRRIIENNEPVLQDNAAASGDAMDDDADEALAQDMADADTVAESGLADEEPAAPPLSLADVAARARAFPPASGHEATPVRSVDRDTYSSAYDMDEAAADDLREALAASDPVEAPVAEVVTPIEAKSAEPVERMTDTMDYEADHASAGPRESTGQLVSVHTGEKVAAAFGELDAAIAAGQSRSFDEIAEEMLRPMLTQWLDDNLPTLVERLVREEIERVSRGNRR